MREKERVVCGAIAALACFGSLSFANTTDNQTVKLDEIKVVSAVGYEQNIADAPASIFVITKEELEKKSFNDLTEVLKNVPGVYVEGGSVFKDISIRGMGSSYTLYLIDGKPMSGNDAHSPNAMAGGVATNSLPPVSAIERIEVVRGPMSSLYGSEAMGGVINIITKKAPSEWSGNVKGEYTKSQSDTSGNGYQGSFNLAGPLVQDFLSLQTYGSILKVDEAQCQDLTKSCGDKSSAHTPDYDVRHIGAKVTLLADEANSLWTAYDYSKQKKRETAGVSTGSSNRVNGLAIKYTVSAGHDLKLDDLILNTYLQNAVTKNPTRGNGIDYEVLTLNTQGTYFFETNSLSIGAQFRKETLADRATNVMYANINTTTNTTVYNPYEESKWQYSLFAEDEWNILEDLALTSGIRFNKDEKFGNNISPRLYLVYSATDDFTLKGGVSTGYKVPSLRQSADDFGGVSGGGAIPPVISIGSPDVKPESSISYEISVAYTSKEIGLGVSLTAYQSEFKDKISSYTVCDNDFSTALPFCTPESATHYGSPGAPALDLVGGPYSSGSKYYNVDKAEIQGLEVTFNYDLLSNLAVGSTYTYTKSEQKSGANAGYALNGISKHMINANIDFRPTNKLSIWTQYNYRSK
ncbi:MAG: TonB-dependent receptor, partial [Campylobacteraceae bacterium]|nr:TonB-dependent receptor [Campylobacteraceae bacterium]